MEHYNPIIPVIRRIPNTWRKADPLIGHRSSARSITEGYIDAYDPDFFAILGKCDVGFLKLDKDRTVTTSDILKNVEHDGTPSYGAGLFELLRYLVETELKFVRRTPLQLSIPDLDRKFDLFLASIAGKLPDNIETRIKDNYRDYMDSTEPPVGIENYTTILKRHTLFPRRLTSLYIDARPSSRSIRDSCMFFLNATNTYDIIDYWNLRAMGWSVLPVPLQSAASDSTRQVARDFIEEHFGYSRYSPQVWYETTILSSRSVDESEVLSFAKSLDIKPPSNPQAFKYAFQRWYPRIWDEWARDKDGVDGCELNGGGASYDFPEKSTQVDARTVDPKFVARFGGGGEPRYANVLDFHIYGSEEPMAQVIPAGAGMDMVRAIGGLESDSWRFSRKELVHLVQHPDWKIWVSVPLAKEVFSAWMKTQGWEIGLSSPGNIAYQMTRRLGGSNRLSILSHAGILALLRKMENGKVVSKEEFSADIARTANDNRFLRDRRRLMDWLLESKMIRLGAELQCPSCQQRSWFSIKDLDYHLQCHNCFEHFDIPMGSPDQIKWAYRAFGPFSLPGRAYGVYSVLLTLRFFSQLMHDLPITPMFSFFATKASREVEIDLGLMLKEKKFGVTETRLVFAEYKNNDNFKRTDIDKMKWVAEQFPGAIIVFATLNKHLTTQEKKLLAPLVNKGRRQWKADMPYNPVLILTATELLTDFGPPQCWSHAGDTYKPFADQYRRSLGEIISLCDITEQIYLGLKPWHEWLRERREHARKLKTPSVQT